MGLVLELFKGWYITLARGSIGSYKRTDLPPFVLDTLFYYLFKNLVRNLSQLKGSF